MTFCLGYSSRGAIWSALVLQVRLGCGFRSYRCVWLVDWFVLYGALHSRYHRCISVVACARSLSSQLLPFGPFLLLFGPYMQLISVCGLFSHFDSLLFSDSRIQNPLKMLRIAASTQQQAGSSRLVDQSAHFFCFSNMGSCIMWSGMMHLVYSGWNTAVTFLCNNADCLNGSDLHTIFKNMLDMALGNGFYILRLLINY